MPNEPLIGKSARVTLILGKFRVMERDAKYMKIALGGSTTMTCTIEDYMDVRSGDLLTFYTEVLFKPPAGAN